MAGGRWPGPKRLEDAPCPTAVAFTKAAESRTDCRRHRQRSGIGAGCRLGRDGEADAKRLRVGALAVTGHGLDGRASDVERPDRAAGGTRGPPVASIGWPLAITGAAAEVSEKLAATILLPL